MRRQCAVPVEAAHTQPLIYWLAARAPPCRSSCVDACEIFREPAFRSKLSPLWDGWAEASVVPAAGKLPMGPNWWITLVVSAGTGRLVCVGALLAQLRGGTTESWRLVLTGGEVRTPDCQKNALRSWLGEATRIGGESFGRSEAPPPCVSRASRQRTIVQIYQAPLLRHFQTFQAPWLDLSSPQNVD